MLPVAIAMDFVAAVAKKCFVVIFNFMSNGKRFDVCHVGGRD